MSPHVENPVELDTYALSTVVYAEDDEGRILLMQRAEGTAMAGQFFMPGGIVDPGETPDEGVVRELRAETGLEFVGEPTMVGCYPLWIYGRDFLQLSYRGRVTGSVVASHEHTDHRWVDPVEMRGLFTDEGIAAISGGDERIARLLTRIGVDLERYLALR